MSKPQFLLALWNEMLAACGTPDFRNKSDRLAHEYKKSTGAEQGEYHRLLSVEHKLWAANPANR